MTILCYAGGVEWRLVGDGLLPEGLHESVMSHHRLDDVAVLDVGDIVFPANSADDFSDFNKMCMRHSREKMMFDLVVEAAKPPGCQPAVGGKVRCGLQLVSVSGVLQFAFRITCGERCLGYQMSNLEDQ